MLLKVCKSSDIDEGMPAKFDVNGIPIMITKVRDNFYATSAICTHEEADLSLGMLSDQAVTCPLHQAKFDLSTGTVLQGPNGTDASTIKSLKTYRLENTNDELWIEI